MLDLGQSMKPLARRRPMGMDMGALNDLPPLSAPQMGLVNTLSGMQTDQMPSNEGGGATDPLTSVLDRYGSQGDMNQGIDHIARYWGAYGGGMPAMSAWFNSGKWRDQYAGMTDAEAQSIYDAVASRLQTMGATGGNVWHSGI